MMRLKTIEQYATYTLGHLYDDDKQVPDVLIGRVKPMRMISWEQNVLEQICAAFLDRDEQTLVIDLQQTRALESGAMGGLVQSYKLSKSLGRDLQLVHVPPRILDELRLVGLEAIFTVHEHYGTLAGRR